MKKKRKVWRWILLAVIIVAVFIVFFVLRQSNNASARYTEETVRSGNIETYYSFSGNVAVRNSQNIAAKANVTVRDIYVQRDDTVAVGTPVMRLSNGEIIKADIAGEVTEIHVSEGDTVSMGAPLMDIVDFDDLQVLLKVDEFDVSAVTVGKEAAVTIDALGITYQTPVEHISKQAFSAGDINYYEAKLAVPEDIEQVLPGMKVDVRILSEQSRDALLLPMTAMQFDDYNKPFVYIRNSAGDVVSQPVSTGIQDGTTVEITEGLRLGDTVLVPQSRALYPMMMR